MLINLQLLINIGNNRGVTLWRGPYHPKELEMEQIKVAGEVSQEEALSPEAKKAQEVRSLSELELVLIGGGDCVNCW